MLRVISYIVGLSSLVCSSALYAEYDADALQKLFTDKRQRVQIDAARSGNYSGSQFEQVNKVKVNGYMTRSDGKSVVWVNNKNTLDSSSIGNVKVQRSSIGKSKKVVIHVDGKTAKLKPGETWLKETGKIVDSH